MEAAALAACVVAAAAHAWWSEERIQEFMFHPPLTRYQIRAGSGFRVARSTRADCDARYWESVPSDARCILLYLHGRAENIGQARGPLLDFKARALRERGMVIGVAAAEYPGYSPRDKPGVKPTDSGAKRASLLVARTLLRRHPNAQLYVVGYSLGSAIAAWVASRLVQPSTPTLFSSSSSASSSSAPKQKPSSSDIGSQKPQTRRESCLAGLALLSPFRSVADLVRHHVSDFVADALVPSDLLNTADCVLQLAHQAPQLPLLFVHGELDSIIPHSHSAHLEAVFRRGDTADGRFRNTEGADAKSVRRSWPQPRKLATLSGLDPKNPKKSATPLDSPGSRNPPLARSLVAFGDGAQDESAACTESSVGGREVRCGRRLLADGTHIDLDWSPHVLQWMHAHCGEFGTPKTKGNLRNYSASRD